MNRSSNYSPFFKFACKVLKYYLLSVVGFTIACLTAAMLGALEEVLTLLPDAVLWLLRLAMMSLCLMVAAVIAESLRY
jgi:hypothetical protein